MARHPDDEMSWKEWVTNRRSVLKAVGGTTAALGVSGALGSAVGQVDGSSSFDHHILLEASQENPDTYLDVSFTTTGPIAFADEAESGTDTIVENDDGTYTATSVRMNPGALDSYEFSGEVVDYSVTDGYELASVEVDGEPTTFADLVGETDNADDGSNDGNYSSQSPRVFVIDGTGDPETVARYDVRVTGTLERDESHSVTADDSSSWDLIGDYVDDNRAAGLIGNGKDAYRFTGEIASISFEGKADLTLLSE